MPYMTFRDNPNQPDQPARYRPANDLPQHLSHKPVYALPYHRLDTVPTLDPNANDGEDMRWLSVGISQWSDEQVSIKAMRNDNGWSRQSEELPLHRSFDMALFAAMVLFNTNGNQVDIPAGTFGQNRNIRIIRERRAPNYDDFINMNMPLYRRRLKQLLNILTELDRQGQLDEGS